MKRHPIEKVSDQDTPLYFGPEGVSNGPEMPILSAVTGALKGDMSLVGPRLERPEFVPQLEAAIPRYRERLQALPGVTGLAQIHLGPDTDLSIDTERVAFAGPDPAWPMRCPHCGQIPKGVPGWERRAGTASSAPSTSAGWAPATSSCLGKLPGRGHVDAALPHGPRAGPASGGGAGVGRLSRVLYVISLDPSRQFGSLEEQIVLLAQAFRDESGHLLPLFNTT